MVDWTFYSPKIRMVSAGELLKAIPSDRIWRLERAVMEQGEELLEMVRAAEQLLSLDVRVRLQNEPAAALALRVRDPVYSDRAVLDRLQTFPSKMLALVAELQLSDSAIQGGHLDICDDVLAGLETLFPGGIALSRTGEIVSGAELTTVLGGERFRVSHIDIAYLGEPERRDFLGQQLMSLPGLGPKIVGSEHGVSVRTRLSGALTPEESKAICNATMELAKYARGGHVRFRERGTWRDAVSGVGSQVAPLPQSGGGVLGRLSKLLRK